MKESMIKIWVDDEREMPEGFDVWERTVLGTLECIEMAYKYSLPIELSLDHDAGSYADKGGDYIKILDWLERESREHFFDWERFIKENITFHLHTANPVGKENMRRIIQKNGWREV